MFLPAQYLKTCSDRESAIADLELLGNTSIQDLDEVDNASGVLILNAKHFCDGVAVPVIFILLSMPDGEQVFVATGNHLATTAAGAKLAITDVLLPLLLEGEIETPADVRVFEFTYGGEYVLH